LTFFRFLANRIAEWLVRNGGIRLEERELIAFGLDKLFSTILCFVIAFALGLFFRVPIEVLVFYVSFYVLRIYAGGYHADTQLRCFIISICVMIPPIAAIRYHLSWYSNFVHMICLACGAAVILILSPVDNKDKKLDMNERHIYRNRSLIALSITGILSTLLQFLSGPRFSSATICGILLAAVMAVSGKIKNSLQRS